MANSRIEPAATVADVLAGRDWDEFCRGRLRTASFWHNIGVINAGPVSCLMCNDEDETVNHVLFQCPYARRVWRVLTKEYEFSFYCTTWEDLEGTVTQIWKTQKGRVIVRVYMAAIYYIWIERCRRRNGEIAISPWSVTLRGAERNPSFAEEVPVWINPNPQDEEEEIDPEQWRTYEELLKRWMENTPRENADWLESSDDESEASVEEIGPEEFDRMRAKEKGKQPILEEEATDEETTEGSGGKRPGHPETGCALRLSPLW
ncbi:hypothetical protein MLD38_035113 [Melastoma candidum]|uniref:Uncharacterized protein n=1 Tax=Melastoma candidum TaxID=119954 RepID=A0ACB9MCJ5_9MYRT|nr:hypothetical protein MLD38_035113 [Melastoma candidum]